MLVSHSTGFFQQNTEEAVSQNVYTSLPKSMALQHRHCKLYIHRQENLKSHI
jgi:hypothetical protein